MANDAKRRDTVTDAAIDRQRADLYPAFFSIESAALALDVSEDAIYRLIKSHGLPATRLTPGLRGKFRIDRLRLFAWMDERRVHVPTVNGSAA